MVLLYVVLWSLCICVEIECVVYLRMIAEGVILLYLSYLYYSSVVSISILH